MKKAVALLSALAVGLVTAACAQNSGSETPPAQEAEPAAANALEVTMQDYAFAIEGEATAGPLLLNFNNIGEEIHHAIVGKLAEGKTIEDVQALIEKDPNSPPPPWFDDTPVDMAVLSPEQTSGIVLDAEEGNYVLLCFMPDPEGKPHVTHGMAQTFEVGPAADAAEIEADVELSMTEEGVDEPEISGPSMVTVTNDADKSGEVFVAQLAEGKTFEDVEPWFRSGMKGPAPVTFFGGTHEMKPGDSVTLNLDLEPGDYQIVASYQGEKGPVDVPTDFTVAE